MIIDRDRRSEEKQEPARPVPAPRTPTRVPPQGPRRIDNLDRLFLYRRGELSWDQMTGFRGGPGRRQGRRLVLWSWMALLIDGLILVSASSFFLVAFALMMRSPLREFVVIGKQIGLMRLFALSFVGLSWLYMVTTRILFGFSLGEWACGLRLGQPTARLRASYPFMVMLRASLILATGLIPLPILSLLTGRDLPGKISGLHLISLK